MDTKRQRIPSGKSIDDAIDVDDTSTSTCSHNDNDDSPVSKRHRQADDEIPSTMASNSPNGSIKLRPIKLLATHQDEEVRKAHWKENGNHLHWSYTQCWTLREMLGLDRNTHDDYNGSGDIDFLILSNYIVDFDFLLSEIPEIVSIPSVVVIYGHADDPSGITAWKQVSTNTKLDFLHRDPSDRRLSLSNPLSISIPFACHHTKLFLVGYSSGRLRVIVHTSNIRYADIHYKCQGAFLQDFFLKESDENEYSTSNFEETLLSYLSSYRYLDCHHTWQISDPEPCTLLDQISKYDFASSKGILIPSIPGFHSPSTQGQSTLGYLAVQKAIRDTIPSPIRRNGGGSGGGSGPIVCQFSSIGSLSENYLKSLWNAWDVIGNRPVRLELVYPTYQEIKESVEGLAGGGSVPGTCKNVNKPFLSTLWHKWKKSTNSLNCTMEKGRNVPHIKTYYQVDEQEQNIQWFVLGSHNLSKAAWGELQNGNRGPTFKLFHWELGIFLSPQTLGVDRLVPFHFMNNPAAASIHGGETKVCEIPLPYSFRPQRYDARDQPWTIDTIN